LRLDRAVILAAGVGSRLKWLTAGRPKALMPVAGIPVIIHIIRRLSSQGIHDIAINVHHHAEKIVERLGDGSRYGVRLYFSREDHLLDSGGGVKKALTLLPGDGQFVVHNTDVFSDIDVKALGMMIRKNEATACLALVNNPPHHPQGDFGLQGGRVEARHPSEPSYTYTGIAVMHEDVFSDYAADTPFPLKAVFDDLKRQGKLCGILHQGMWLDIGRPRDWINASHILRD